jgi:TolA-binding protein
MLADYEGKAPAINRITLTSPKGKQVLPVPYDYAELQKNDTLEILTGDKIDVQYIDDRFVTQTKERQTRGLHVSFSDGTIDFTAMTIGQAWNGKDMPVFTSLLRFQYNEPVDIWIRDPDMDMTPGQDKVKVEVSSKSGGTREVIALESQQFPGIFSARMIPVQGQPTAENQITVEPGGILTASYVDEENRRPGVPFKRYTRIRHAVYQEPQLQVSHAVVERLEFEELLKEGLIRSEFFRPGFKNLTNEEVARLSESARKAYQNAQGKVVPRWSLDTQMVNAEKQPEGGIANVIGTKIDLSVIAPHLILRADSAVKIYVQTESARQAVGAGNTFDIEVPGTLDLNANISGEDRDDRRRFISMIPIYADKSRIDMLRGQSKTQGRRGSENVLPVELKTSIPLILDILPKHGVLTPEQKIETGYYPSALVLKPDDTIHSGFEYTDEAGQKKWLTAASKVISHPAMDIMDETYRENTTAAYVGETIHMRVIDLGADYTDGPDTVNVLMQAKSGAKHYITLRETDAHTGVFQGSPFLTHVDSVKAILEANPESLDPMRDGFPVVYGDVVASRYRDAKGTESPVYMISVSKGADGLVKPFSKVYDDPEVAMRVQFSLAEAYLELAKRHRAFGESQSADHEYDRARDLLAKAMDQFKDPATRAQAEYLLGNLAMEEANDTPAEDTDLRDSRYRAALSRFLTVTGSYPDTVAASKAQFKIATIYEKLKEPDIAAQEYVKLAYKYPDSEHLATAMARLGTHFLKKAQTYEKQAEPLLADADNKDAMFEGEAMSKMATKEYLKAADIFGRLQKRFPDHELAGPAGLRSGQAFMRGKEISKAIVAFLSVINNQSYDGPDIRAQAMYWGGMCFEESGQAMPAYSMYKRLTYDFPESRWASFARAQLSQEKLLNLELGLEEKRVEEGRMQ